MDELGEKIAGEIALSESPGSVMKKWRELFGITQAELSKAIKISASTISDYESNRRLSPGVGIIKRFVSALFEIDETRGSTVRSSLEKFSGTAAANGGDIYTIHDFSSPISGTDFARIIEGKVIASPNQLDEVKLFGYTKLDSLRVILEMSPSDYPKLFGSTTERVFIFQNVSTGRSPLVVIRVAPIKPKVVLIHNLTNIDKLAIKIAQIEHIPLLTTKLSMEEIEERLSKV
ncbi:helix-turn-helix domain-containing protein [Candidatus Marsarchaeota archaeon]|nr:helix-turn-helix domain-containing protein [Candidatus Marsarchaeota archaeon]MCL5404369.1 helix-turn-helix domain-containing protein [Candidatus Marsarchaeota archaeon]